MIGAAARDTEKHPNAGAAYLDLGHFCSNFVFHPIIFVLCAPKITYIVSGRSLNSALTHTNKPYLSVFLVKKKPPLDIRQLLCQFSTNSLLL